MQAVPMGLDMPQPSRCIQPPTCKKTTTPCGKCLACRHFRPKCRLVEFAGRPGWDRHEGWRPATQGRTRKDQDDPRRRSGLAAKDGDRIVAIDAGPAGQSGQEVVGWPVAAQKGPLDPVVIEHAVELHTVAQLNRIRIALDEGTAVEFAPTLDEGRDTAQDEGAAEIIVVEYMSREI